MLAALLWLTLCAEPLSPDQAATIRAEQQKAQAAVQQKYGNKKSSELSSAERSAMMKDQAAADRAVLDKAGVDAKTWARSEASRGRGDVQPAQAAEKPAAKAVPKEIIIQRGGEETPTAEGEVVIERGTGSEPPPKQRRRR